MAEKKHKYLININGGSGKSELIYQYGRVKNISLRIGRQRATIIFETNTAMTAVDITSFRGNLFRDAYRKAYLLHALIKNEGLVVNRIDVNIDGEQTSFDENDSFFPFMFSMIEKKPLTLSESWSDLVPAFLASTKTKMEKDYRFVSAFSYFASKSKRYLIEQFTNLWTAVNAYYSYIALCYENELRVELGIAVNNEPIKYKKELLMIKNDKRSIGALCWLLYPKYEYPKNSEELWKHNNNTEKILSKYSSFQIQELYEASFAELTGTALPSKYTDLAECAELFGVPLFTYLLLIYPYHWRCDLFHGNRATMLFCAYNDYEISVLHTVNYFLDRFLNEAIPQLFQEDFFVNDYEKVKQYMRKISLMSNGVNDFDKKFEKERKIHIAG